MTYNSQGDGEDMFNNDMLRWSSQQPSMEYPTGTSSTLQAVVSPVNSSSPLPSSTPLPAVNTTNPAIAPPPALLDPTKQYHPEWGVIKEQDFHPLTLKHQRDLENIFASGSAMADFYFWQANLGGYCMADMIQGK